MAEENISTDEVLSLLSGLLHEVKPEASEQLQTACDKYPGLKDIVDIIIDLRIVTSSLSKGKLEESIPSHGYVVSNLKALQANLHHLVWQMAQVSKGDYSQRIDYLGDFSESFNAMCERLESEKSALTELAQNDSLTKLANRQYLDYYLEDLIEVSRASNQPFAALMIDIDFFKRVNDSYGHDVGDQVLMRTAKYLNKVFRGSDFVARYGGEEFVAILPRASLDTALMIAERAREYFEEHPIITDDGLVIGITISIGVSVFEPEDENADPVIKRSDNALYAAKRNGRNQVQSA